MALEDEASRVGDSISSATDTAGQADKAILNTADKYLKRY